MLKYLIQDFHLSLFKNYGSLTHETKIKDAVNMEDLICLLATVRTLKATVSSRSDRSGLPCLVQLLSWLQVSECRNVWNTERRQSGNY